MIARLLLVLMGATMIGCKPATSPGRGANEMTTAWTGRRTLIYVYDCSSHPRLTTIWADSNMMMPMANPLLADASGNYQFWAEGCSKVVAKW